MNELVIMTIVKKALITGVTVGGPILIISLVVGLNKYLSSNNTNSRANFNVCTKVNCNNISFSFRWTLDVK